MFRHLGLVISIGLADSLNPTTVAPALYLASVDHARKRVAEFTAGVFVVYFLGGCFIALGPGQLLLALVPHPSHTVAYVLEIVAGVALMVGAAWLIVNRHSLSQKQLPTAGAGSRSSFLLGAGITAIELPTAFPYFAAIAAIIGSGLGIVSQLILLLVFNICFVMPQLVILATLTIMGDRAPAAMARVRRYAERRWPLVLGLAALLAGTFVITLGITGLTARSKSGIGVLSRRLRHVLGG
jgi:cytochrome c biogenesis protein CcdA